MPGVVINTATRTGPNQPTTLEETQMFVMGYATRGPVDEAVLVTSIKEFEDTFGGRITTFVGETTYLYDTVATFFEEGGTRAYVARLADGATTGYINLLDSGSTATMRVTANGPGTWASDYQVQVAAGTASGTFVVKLLDSDGDTVYSTGNCSTVAQAVGRINTSAVASRYVVASDLATSSNNPDVLAATSLDDTVAGANGNAAEPEDMASALDLFLDSYGSGVVCNPELPYGNATVDEAIATHCKTYNRIAFMYGQSDDTISEAGDSGLALSEADNAEHVAYYYPWVYIPTSVAGVERLVPPVGYAAAKRAVANIQVGPHQPPAGLLSVAKFVTGVATDISKANGDILDEKFVNAIRVINNTVRIYGARSTSSDVDNFRFITAQDVVNKVVVEANRSLEDLVFAPIDGRNTIFANIESRLYSVLEPLRVKGALFEAFDSNGKRIDYGYTVKCDASINPTSQLADGTVKARVGMRVSSVGSSIEVDITKSNLTASVVSS